MFQGALAGLGSDTGTTVSLDTAVAQVLSLEQKLPHAMGAAKKKKKKSSAFGGSPRGWMACTTLAGRTGAKK